MAEIVVPPGVEDESTQEQDMEVEPLSLVILWDPTSQGIACQPGGKKMSLAMVGMMLKGAEMWLQDQIAAARIQVIQAQEVERQQNAAIMGQLRTKH